MTKPTHTSFSIPICYGDEVFFSQKPEDAAITTSSKSMVGRNSPEDCPVGDYLPGSLNSITNTFTVENKASKLIKLDLEDSWGFEDGH